MTEEAKHTPGPWDIEGGRPLKLHFGEETRFWVILNKDGYSPAIVPPWDVVPPIATEEAKANARLIATAPELFEYVESSAQNGCATAIALIAKAKGKP